MPQPAGPPPGHVRVRLSHRPDEDHDVPEDEVPILRQQGLLVENAGADEGTAGKAAGAKAAAGKDQA